MKENRIQLSLFADAAEAASIERVRQQYNPLQYELIKCHITLCREHELTDLQTILVNLSHLNMPVISIEFGQVLRFADGKGVFLPAVGELASYHELRKRILKNVIATPEKPEPHITLMHPGNSSCTDNMFQQLQALDFPASLQFRTISLIEQIEGGKWLVLEEFKLQMIS